jgi:hypothetical protein
MLNPPAPLFQVSDLHFIRRKIIRRKTDWIERMSEAV